MSHPEKQLQLRWFLGLCLLLGFTLCVQAQGNVQCMDENNNPVDWYVVYKFPKLQHSSDPRLKGGNGYMYITSSTVNRGWQISSNTIDSKNNMFTHTLPFIKQNSPKIFTVVYNDQGEKTCFNCGHTKGIVAGDEHGGIWLVHSIPHYINGDYPPTGYKYGQSALCLSLPKDQLDSIGHLLAFNSPGFQPSNINEVLQRHYPTIMAAYKGVKVSSPWSLEKIIRTVRGAEFTAFAKSKPFNQDLYDWVASSLQTNLYAQTWIHGANILPSSCNLDFRVENVAAVLIPHMNVEFSSYNDHSKWAVSSSGESPWVCVGDINRAESQKHRGGGTVCLKNRALWESYIALVRSFKGCNTY